ncbi:hypothetical protein Hanom_Chr13g01238041 [Helianthus anomalus]
MRVLVTCCLHERVFNKYYCVLASRLCNHDNNHKFTLQVLELIARIVPMVSRFFTFSPHLLKIAGMLPMVCYFVTRIVP